MFTSSFANPLIGGGHGTVNPAVGYLFIIMVNLFPVILAVGFLVVLEALRRCHGRFQVRHLLAFGLFVSLVSWLGSYASCGHLVSRVRTISVGIAVTFIFTLIAALRLNLTGPNRSIPLALIFAAAVTFIALCVEYGGAITVSMWLEDWRYTIGRLGFLAAISLLCGMLALVVIKGGDI